MFDFSLTDTTVGLLLVGGAIVALLTGIKNNFHIKISDRLEMRGEKGERPAGSSVHLELVGLIAWALVVVVTLVVGFVFLIIGRDKCTGPDCQPPPATTALPTSQAPTTSGSSTSSVDSLPTSLVTPTTPITEPEDLPGLLGNIVDNQVNSVDIDAAAGAYIFPITLDGKEINETDWKTANREFQSNWPEQLLFTRVGPVRVDADTGAVGEGREIVANWQDSYKLTDSTHSTCGTVDIQAKFREVKGDLLIYVYQELGTTPHSC